MELDELRLRCIEAAARMPDVHADGRAAGVLATAQKWAEWIRPGPNKDETLHLPKKPK